MSKKIFSFLIVAGVLFITSCGGSSNKKEPVSDTTEMETAESETVESTWENSDIDSSDDKIDEDVMHEGTTSSVSGADLDEALDQYEEMIDKIVKIATKLSKNDLSVMGDYTSLVADLENYEKKINNCKGEMTPQQLQRLTKLTEKMVSATTKAAAAMSKVSAGAIENLENLENLINF